MFQIIIRWLRVSTIAILGCETALQIFKHLWLLYLWTKTSSVSIHCLSWNKKNILAQNKFVLLIFFFYFLPFCSCIFMCKTREEIIVFLMACEKKDGSLIFNDNRIMPTSGSTVPVGNYWKGWPSGWDFPVPTEHQWWILFILSGAGLWKFWNLNRSSRWWWRHQWAHFQKKNKKKYNITCHEN